MLIECTNANKGVRFALFLGAKDASKLEKEAGKGATYNIRAAYARARKKVSKNLKKLSKRVLTKNTPCDKI